MEDADWNSYRQKLCYLMHRTDICGRAVCCHDNGMYAVMTMVSLSIAEVLQEILKS